MPDDSQAERKPYDAAAEHAPQRPAPDTRTTARSRWLAALARGARPSNGSEPEPAAPRRARRKGPTPFSPWRREDEPVSLFGEILDWMLAPLLLLWPLSVTITYLVARSAADLPFDRALISSVDVIAAQIKPDETSLDGLRFAMPVALDDLLHAETVDTVSFMVLGLRGEHFAGDRELPLPPDDNAFDIGTTRLRTDQLRGQEIRLAYGWRQVVDAPDAQPVLIQIAETMDRRHRLANEIIKGVIAPQFVVMPLTVLLVWFGLSRGLAPLTLLQARIRARRPEDVSPIDEHAAPEEMAPLVGAFNDMLDRQRQNLVTQRRFLADAAHQMKTPLAGLRTQAELAVRETDPHQLQRSLRQIASSSERAAHLVNQLLALARAEHQAADPGAFEPVDLVQLAREQVRDWVPQALARGIDLGFEEEYSDAGDPAPRPQRMLGVPIMLRELLNNLIDNALRYTPAGTEPPGAVTVRVRAIRDAVLLEVEDTGPGIPEAERHLVFDRFYRVLGTNVDGSGLGLAIVREIVAQHDALVRIGANPHQPAGGATPGTQISVEFGHIVGKPPTLNLA
jgi:two-component system sensor histidine kinase TctE